MFFKTYSEHYVLFDSLRVLFHALEVWYPHCTTRGAFHSLKKCARFLINSKDFEGISRKIIGFSVKLYEISKKWIALRYDLLNVESSGWKENKVGGFDATKYKWYPFFASLFYQWEMILAFECEFDTIYIDITETFYLPHVGLRRWIIFLGGSF